MEEEKLPLTTETVPEKSLACATNEPVPAACETEAADEKNDEVLTRMHKNGLSLAEAESLIANAGDVPAVDLLWENPLADTLNVRERKWRVAEELCERFPKTDGSLARAAGEIVVSRWNAAWQQATERAARRLADAARALAEASADFTVVSGLIPPGGTLAAIRDLQNLVGALLAVRGEDAVLILGNESEVPLVRLREAASLAENCARHKALLSLVYPENAPENPNLEVWLKTWNESAFSRAFPRWMKRRKVVASLRKLAGEKEKSPQDPRVDLGNLIAIRVCKKEFEGKFSDLEKAFPSLLSGMKPCGATARIFALEKARTAVASALEKLSSVPEKRDAWNAVFTRWVSGKDAAFSKSGAVEKAFAGVASALSGLGAARNALAEAVGAERVAVACDTPEKLVAWAEEFLSDREKWSAICAWNMSALAAGRRGMAALADALRAGTLDAETAKKAFEAEYCRRWKDAVLGSGIVKTERESAE